MADKLSKTLAEFLKNGDEEKLIKEIENSNYLLIDVYKSKNVTIEGLLNSRVCRSLT